MRGWRKGKKIISFSLRKLLNRKFFSKDWVAKALKHFWNSRVFPHRTQIYENISYFFIIFTGTTIAWLSDGLCRPSQQWLWVISGWIWVCRTTRWRAGRSRPRPSLTSPSASKRCRRSGTKSSLRWKCNNFHDWFAFIKKWVFVIRGSVSPGERNKGDETWHSAKGNRSCRSWNWWDY